MTDTEKRLLLTEARRALLIFVNIVEVMLDKHPTTKDLWDKYKE